MLTHMDDMSDNELASLADTVFRQGLKDGRTLSMPRDKGAVMLLIPPHPHRIFQARKLRQVYGAGYDIARTLREINALKVESA